MKSKAFYSEVKFCFRCGDDKIIRMDLACCFESGRIRDYVSEGVTGEVSIMISRNIMGEVNKFCVSRWETVNSCDDDAHLTANTLLDFEYEFAIRQPLPALVSLVQAAIFLKIKSLLDLACAEIDNRLKGRFAYRCMDNKVVTLDMACCFESEMIFVHLEDGSRGPVSIRIPSKIMAAVESFCIARTKVNHSCGGDAKYASRLLEDFDRHFASQHPLSLLVQFMHAAMKLRIRSLLDLTRAEILKRIKGKTDDEIFKIIDIPRFTHEDFQRARVVNDWAFNIK